MTSHVDHGNRHGPGGSDATPPGDWYYATPLAPATTPDDYVSGADGNAAFENGWGNVALPDTTYSPLRWRFVTKGRVEIVGAIDGGALGTVCVALPAEFWPDSDLYGVISSTDGSRAMTISVSASTGEVTVVAVPASSPGDAYVPSGSDVALADGGTGASLADPGADRIMFWDDSASTVDWLTPGTGLSISGTTINASGGAPSGSAGGALDGTYPNPGLAAAVAGSGLSESSDVLAVNVDGTTIEISSDALRLKDTTVAPATYGDATHVAQVAVNAKGQVTSATNVAITASGITAIPSDGWIDDTANTWTYASATTFTVTGDRTAIFAAGTRLKLTQTTVKYFVVASSVHAGGTTTVTITGGSDYTFANAAVTLNYYSMMMSPQGWPGWFNYAPAATGFSSKTSDLARFSVVGRVCHINFAISGTSNATTFTITLPILVANSQVTNPVLELVRVTDNGASTGTGAIRYDSNTSTATFAKALNAAGGFTASAVKGSVGNGFYEI